MTDQSTFMDTLRSVAEIVRISGEPVKREDIKNYFKDMELTDAQEEMVYQYLLNPPTEEEQQPADAKEETENMETAEAEEETEAENEEAEKQKLSDSVFFQMYMEDINELPNLSEEDMQMLYERLLSGDDSVISQLSDAWLLPVIEQSKAYISRNVNMEDVIQEGNIGLLLGLTTLLGDSEVTDVPAFLTASIKQSMEEFISEMLEEGDLENTVVAKSNLIYEAKKHLAETLGHLPSINDLCSYTNMTAAEIEDILSLAENSKK